MNEAGEWERGPGPDERCAACDGPIPERGGQFLGLSNGDWSWCCNLTCLIAEAEGERDLYTDAVGPPEPFKDCGMPSPWGDGRCCLRPKGHRGNHQSEPDWQTLSKLPEAERRILLSLGEVELTRSETRGGAPTTPTPPPP